MVKAAIFDLDGVLIDVRKRLEKCFEESKGARNKVFWRCFLSPKYMYLDEPNNELIQFVRELKRKGYKIIIVTGRREDTQKEATLEELKRFGIPFDEIYFRKPNDFRKDYVYKMDIVKKLLEKGYQIDYVYDDSERVCEALARMLPNARVVLYKIETGEEIELSKARP